MQDPQTTSAPATLTARDEPNTPADAAYPAPRAATPHLITYQPKLLVPAQAPHDAQRTPRGQAATTSCHPSTPCRFVDLMRWADRPYAELAIKDMGIRIDIDLDAPTLRTLAFHLLDAAHDIEQVPFAQQIGRAA